MRIVVDVESDERQVLGIYVRSEEDAVFYNDWETGAGEWAPVDCVEVVPGRINYRGPGGLVEASPAAALVEEAVRTVAGAFGCNPDESAGADLEQPARPAGEHVRVSVVFEHTRDDGPRTLGDYVGGADDDYVRYSDADGRLLWVPNSERIVVVAVPVPLPLPAVMGPFDRDERPWCDA